MVSDLIDLYTILFSAIFPYFFAYFPLYIPFIYTLLLFGYSGSWGIKVIYQRVKKKQNYPKSTNYPKWFFWIFCRKGARFCRKSSGELQKTCKNLQKTKNVQKIARFLQKCVCMPADFGFCDCSILQKMQKTLQNCRKSRFVCKTSNRIAPRAFFGLQSPPRAGKPARRNHYGKFCHTLRRVSAGVGLYRRPRR